MWIIYQTQCGSDLLWIRTQLALSFPWGFISSALLVLHSCDSRLPTNLWSPTCSPHWFPSLCSLPSLLSPPPTVLHRTPSSPAHSNSNKLRSVSTASSWNLKRMGTPCRVLTSVRNASTSPTQSVPNCTPRIKGWWVVGVWQDQSVHSSDGRSNH